MHVQVTDIGIKSPQIFVHAVHAKAFFTVFSLCVGVGDIEKILLLGCKSVSYAQASINTASCGFLRVAAGRGIVSGIAVCNGLDQYWILFSRHKGASSAERSDGNTGFNISTYNLRINVIVIQIPTNSLLSSQEKSADFPICLVLKCW